MKGFMNFVRTQGVVGLAVGFILGGAVSNLVDALVQGIINPLLSLALGKVDLVARSTVLVEPSVENPQGVILRWGAVLTIFINFLVVAFVVYFGVKALGMADDNKTAAAPAAKKSSARKSSSKKK